MHLLKHITVTASQALLFCIWKAAATGCDSFCSCGACRNLARDASNTSLFGGGDSFNSQGSGGPFRHRPDGSPGSREGSSTDYQNPADVSNHGTSSSNLYNSNNAGAGMYNSSGTGNVGTTGGSWGKSLGALWTQGVGGRGGAGGAIGLQQFGAAAPAGALNQQQQQQEFAGFDMSEDNQPLFVLDGENSGQATQQPQQWVALQRPQQSPNAAVELQQQQTSAAAGDGSSSMLAAMRHVGQVWGEFDRAVMQPVFGGPGSQRGSSQGGGDGSQAQPPGDHPL